MITREKRSKRPTIHVQNIHNRSEASVWLRLPGPLGSERDYLYAQTARNLMLYHHSESAQTCPIMTG